MASTADAEHRAVKIDFLTALRLKKTFLGEIIKPEGAAPAAK